MVASPIHRPLFIAMPKRYTKNFLVNEFTCNCGCPHGTMDPRHMDLLQKLRDVAGPLKVTSGIRCATYNRLIGGAKRSQHVPDANGVCCACDITFATGLRSNRRILQLYTLADQLHFKGIGLYKGRIHVDSRPGRRARWVDHFWNWKDT